MDAMISFETNIRLSQRSPTYLTLHDTSISDLMRARAADVRDVGNRVLALLMGHGESNLSQLPGAHGFVFMLMLLQEDVIMVDAHKTDTCLADGFMQCFQIRIA